jgi:hypothetical protein
MRIQPLAAGVKYGIAPEIRLGRGEFPGAGPHASRPCLGDLGATDSRAILVAPHRRHLVVALGRAAGDGDGGDGEYPQLPHAIPSAPRRGPPKAYSAIRAR